MALSIMLLTGGALPAPAASDVDCQALWLQADADADGHLSGGEADNYLSALRRAGKPAPVEGSITAPLFMEHCRSGTFATAAVDPGAPFPGANSFTEAQARERIAAMGLTGISALTKDADGIWRGTAERSGEKVNVAVDYKGNVVVN